MYSVSPTRRPNSLGPKPSEKRSTLTRDSFATTKCPSSWTKIKKPSTSTAARVYSTKVIMGFRSLGAAAFLAGGAQEVHVIID